MNKRLRKKLVKLGRLNPVSSILFKPGSFFLGEKKLVEHYTLLQSLQPEHPLLTLGKVREDGHFRFASSFVQSAPDPLKTVRFQQGVPETHHPTLHYIDSLMSASIEHGMLGRKVI
jgi:hypothetical protein